MHDVAKNKNPRRRKSSKVQATLKIKILRDAACNIDVETAYCNSEYQTIYMSLAPARSRKRRQFVLVTRASFFASSAGHVRAA
jgi:hypothetical protein